jgi:hypothetical protein
MPNQTGGGSVGQSLHYVDPSAPERSASAGSDLLVQRGLIARPAIGGSRKRRGNNKGGFMPSIMAGVVDNAVVTGPLAAFAARKLWNNRKTRKGGGKKGNIWEAQKAEAKAILEEIAKPSAKNIIAFAAARRNGAASAQSYLNAFRQQKVKKAEEFSAKRIAKGEAAEARQRKQQEEEAQRAAKKAEKEAKKAAADAEKAAKQAAKAAAKATKEAEKVAKGQTRRKKAVAAAPVVEAPVAVAAPKSNERAPTLMQIRREAAANVAAARAEAKAARRSRKVGNNATAAARRAHAKAIEAREKAAAAGNNTTAKKRKSPSAAQKAYFTALKSARETLGAFGKPKGPNMAKWASMKVKGQNTSAFEQNFRTRMGTAKAAGPAGAGAGAPKKLSAVAEANNMQGYSENFESESSVE